MLQITVTPCHATAVSNPRKVLEPHTREFFQSMRKFTQILGHPVPYLNIVCGGKDPFYLNQFTALPQSYRTFLPTHLQFRFFTSFVISGIVIANYHFEMPKNISHKNQRGKINFAKKNNNFYTFYFK